MIDYKNGKIYALKSAQTDKIYIGSTTQDLKTRLCNHKCDYRRKYKHHYVSSYELIQHSDVYIVLIKKYPCECKEDLLKAETDEIKKNRNICVNQLLPIRSKHQYYLDNKEDILKKRKEYYKKNIEVKKEYNKKYRQKNLDKLRNSSKEYYKKNKERLDKYNKQYIKCDCGSMVQRASIARHRRTKKHIRALELQN